jgi:16S rRNA (uracil1498-N3)-methyltransferase
MKQSLKATITVLHEPAIFAGFVSGTYDATHIITHCNPSFRRRKISEVYSRGENAVILIGPEGDFSEDEIKKADEMGFAQVHLGGSRLRTETAGIAACHSIYLINQ